MPKLENLEGRTFGRLTVLQRDTSKKGVYWVCECSCKNKTVISVLPVNLKRHAVTSCGCVKKELSHIEIGTKFDRLTVLEKGPSINYRQTWKCVCECGNILFVKGKYLRNGDTTSCGCKQKEIAKQNGKDWITHGLSKCREYEIWSNMKDKCYNKNHRAYKNYGARGIKVYDKWIHDPESCIKYIMSLKNYGKEGYTLDRINNDGNYEPNNLRWATRSQQTRNRRVTKLNWETVKNIRELSKTMSNSEIGRKLNIKPSYVSQIIHYRCWKESED